MEQPPRHLSNTTEIKLPVFDDSGNQRGDEKLLVEQIGPDRFRLVYSPGFVEGLAAGDVIELSAEDRLGYRIVERAGNLCVWFFFNRLGQNRGPEAERLREEVERIGGWLDGGGAYLLIFTIPVSAGFPAVERVFDAAVTRIAGSEWLYGNVYDPNDGQTPLNWWK